MKYRVVVAQHGCVYVDANSEDEAVDIANHQMTDSVWWFDDWKAVGVEKDDSAIDNLYISKKEYE